MSNNDYVKPPKNSVLINTVIVISVVFIICDLILMKVIMKNPSVEFTEPTAEELEYHYDDAYEGVIITTYNGESQAIRIPAKLDSEPVKQVSFQENRNITHIKLPDGVMVIGGNNF